MPTNAKLDGGTQRELPDAPYTPALNLAHESFPALLSETLKASGYTAQRGSHRFSDGKEFKGLFLDDVEGQRACYLDISFQGLVVNGRAGQCIMLEQVQGLQRGKPQTLLVPSHEKPLPLKEGAVAAVILAALPFVFTEKVKVYFSSEHRGAIVVPNQDEALVAIVGERIAKSSAALVSKFFKEPQSLVRDSAGRIVSGYHEVDLEKPAVRTLRAAYAGIREGLRGVLDGFKDAARRSRAEWRKQAARQ